MLAADEIEAGAGAVHPDEPAEMGPEELRARLDRLGWSQAELARRLGRSTNTVNRWLQGTMPIGFPREVRAALRFFEHAQGCHAAREME